MEVVVMNLPNMISKYNNTTGVVQQVTCASCHTHTHIHTHTRAHTHTYIHTNTRTHAHTRTHTHMHKHKHTRTYISKYNNTTEVVKQDFCESCQSHTLRHMT